MLLVLLVPLPTLLVLLVLRLTDGNLRHSGFPSLQRCRPAEVPRTTSRMMVLLLLIQHLLLHFLYFATNPVVRPIGIHMVLALTNTLKKNRQSNIVA